MSSKLPVVRICIKKTMVPLVFIEYFRVIVFSEYLSQALWFLLTLFAIGLVQAFIMLAIIFSNFFLDLSIHDGLKLLRSSERCVDGFILIPPLVRFTLLYYLISHSSKSNFYT